MMMLISAVTTSVIINVTTILIATATPVESSSSDSLTHVPNPQEIPYKMKKWQEFKLANSHLIRDW